LPGEEPFNDQQRGDDQHYHGLLLEALANLGDRDFVEHDLITSDRINSAVRISAS
jgi:hypothetical protein